MPVALVVTPTASTPPTELATAYLRVVAGAEPHVEVVAGPLIATVGFCCTVNVVVLATLSVQPCLSTAVTVTLNPDGHPAAGLRQVTITWTGELASAADGTRPSGDTGSAIVSVALTIIKTRQTAARRMQLQHGTTVKRAAAIMCLFTLDCGNLPQKPLTGVAWVGNADH